jgi:formate-dependent nitrite reductase membrane component NrfD
MLRVVKLRSPMSLGSWGLSVFGAFATASVAIQAAQDGLLGSTAAARQIARLPSGRIATVGVLPAFFVGGYTGVLLGATAVPLWAKCARLIGPLFLNSAFSSATSAIAIAMAHGSQGREEALERLERLEQVALVTELGLMAAIDTTLGPTARPMREGRTGAIATYGALGAGVVIPLVAVTVNRRLKSRRLARSASLLAMGGGLALRYAAVKAGHLSADDPHATFAMTRKRR